MSKSKKVIAKTVSPKVITENVETKLTDINLSDLVDSFKNVSTTVKESGSRGSYLYKYAENEISPAQIKNEIGKAFRGKRRKEIEKFCAQMSIAVNNNNVESAKEISARFMDHYAKFYTVNDLSLGSVTQSNNQQDRANIDAFLTAIRRVKG